MDIENLIKNGLKSATLKHQFISRKHETKWLKEQINAILDEIGVSKRIFKRTLPRMSGRGYRYEVNAANGKKPSLRQKYVFLVELRDSFRKQNLGIEYLEDENEE